MNFPDVIHNVSQTQLSVARHYGGIKLNGEDYTYDHEKDTLTKSKVLDAELKRKLEVKRWQRTKETLDAIKDSKRQGDLW